MKRLINTLSNLFRLVFPPLCNGCNCKLLDSEYLFCTNCRLDAPFTFDWKVRGNPLEQTLSFASHVVWGAAFLEYHSSQSNYDKVIKRFKFYDRPDFSYNMGRWYGTVLAQEGVDLSHIDYLVPVPLHYKRLLWRGYNQSYLIAKGIGEVLGIKVLKNGVMRTVNNPPQAQRKGRNERERNVKGVFKVKNSQNLSGKNVMIVDDVFTTGSTILELAKVIHRNCKDCSISVVVLARA